MSNPNEFKYLVEEVKVFHRNLQKDNTERRRDEEVTRLMGEFHKSITLPSKIKVIIRPCSDSEIETGNMTEKFNLRTAASLLPVMDALSFHMHDSKQRNCSIDEFGKSIEELLVDLTITQADGNQNAIQVLRGVNEKIAINAFVNGLQNSELRTIIKSRNYSLSKDEEIPKQNAQIFHMQGR
ncbi:hypothetical protein JTB14_017305 [Gonioctena quinquepunctata]|nr:hypothetical protein JTB14_017305 [Gonioctena quinquepunctata]